MPLSDRPAYCRVDAELRFLAVNDTLLRVLGKTRDEMIGRSYLDLYPEASGAPVHLALLEALRSLTPQKQRLWSQPLQTFLDMEIFPLDDGLQVAFSLADPSGAA